jgi:integrase
MVRTVNGYSHSEGKRVDERREVTRKGSKKADAVFLTPAQVKALKKQPNTPQGRRDAVLLALLLDHGLRVSEVAGLEITAVKLAAGELGPFYRPKTDQWDTHKLTPYSKKALKAYLDAGDAPAVGKLLRASYGANRLGSAGVSTRNLSERVRNLGKLAGIDGLSAHDLRHTWASTAAKKGVPLDKMVRKGGWKSPVMAMRYLERAAVADEGMALWED